MTPRPITEADIHAYVDGQLDPDRRAEVEAHLATHVEDAAAAEAWQRQNEALREAFTPVLHEPIPPRLRLEQLGAPARQRQPSRRVLIAASIAFATGAFAGAGGLAVTQWMAGIIGPSAEVSGNLPRLAAEAYRVFAPEILHPVEVSQADEAHLLQWLSKRLGYRMALPDLNAEGYRLVGGRLLAGPRGPAALFMFENEAGVRLTFYCVRLGPVSEAAFRYRASDGLGTVYWISEDLGYAVTGPTDRAALQRIARLLFERLEGSPS